MTLSVLTESVQRTTGGKPPGPRRPKPVVPEEKTHHRRRLPGQRPPLVPPCNRQRPARVKPCGGTEEKGRRYSPLLPFQVRASFFAGLTGSLRRSGPAGRAAKSVRRGTQGRKFAPRSLSKQPGRGRAPDSPTKAPSESQVTCSGSGRARARCHAICAASLRKLCCYPPAPSESQVRKP